MSSSTHPERRVATRWVLLVVGLTFLAILVPFLFWRATWFGTPLTNAQIEHDLTHLNDPQQTQHALSLVADRIIRGDKSVERWYPDVARLANCPIPQIRETAAWVMGQDNTIPQFHQTLLELLRDQQPLVRMNAALGLVRFHDASGHAEILRMLTGEPLLAPEGGRLKRLLNVGQGVDTDTVVARIDSKQEVDVRAGTPGSLARWVVADGAEVAAGDPIAVLSPTAQMAREALRALFLIGQPGDLNAISPYARGFPRMSPEVAEQARLAMEEIRSRNRSGS
jgi:biotin carboxyl carrier protein